MEGKAFRKAEEHKLMVVRTESELHGATSQKAAIFI
jgi:hypothetical protein